MYTSVLLLLGLIGQISGDQPLNNKTFPNGFMFGCSTSAYQIEGAWNESGKGPSIWDTYSHQTPPVITNGDTGDVACDSYHKYKEDVAMLVNLGVNHYRFSISWSRILPNGLTNKVNADGVTYYKNLIKELKKNRIQPLVTLLHYDTPQSIEDMGGWPHPEFVDWFADYARLCFKLFGDDVKYWITFNEARVQCELGYAYGFFAPQKHSPGLAEYMCIHNVIKAHAAAWHIYNDEFRATQKGQVGISIDSDWYEPTDSTNEDDLKASAEMLLFQFGIFGHPLNFGDYPDIVKERIERRSLAQGFSKSRLPAFTEADKEKLKGTLDFIGSNMYLSSLVRPLVPNDPDAMGLYADCEIEAYRPDSFLFAPWGAGKLVRWIGKTYNNIPIIITENGYSDQKEDLDDPGRISYIQQYLSNIKDAMDDGVNVQGYTVWSIMDNLEWKSGYSAKFGLYHVDFQSPNRTRTPRSSAAFYKKLIKTRCLVDSCNDK